MKTEKSLRNEEIIKLTLEKLKCETSSENIFVFKTLLGGQYKKNDISNVLIETGKTISEIHGIFDSLNKKDVIKWVVIKGIAMVMLTKTAKKEFLIVYASITGESIEEFFSDTLQKGRSFSQNMRRKASQALRKIASGLDDKEK
jgi:hypothetical protein